ncbi:ABC-2 family transporter permease [Roseimaritima ulvae]|nr:hypothetical protein [Roseimaritima ulvae]
MSRPHDVGDAVPYAFTAIQLATPLFILLALALGLSQSIPDSRPDVRAHLLHRPISRRQIFAAKTITGAALYLFATLLPLGVMAIWLSSVGPERIPVTGQQVVPAMAMAVACFACYMGAQWTVYRPAKWFGTRLLPLVFTAVVPLVVFAVCNLPSAFVWLCLLVALAVGLGISTAGAVHAFVNLADLPAASSPRQRSPATVVGILIGSSLVMLFVGLGLILWEERSASRSWDPQASYATVVDHSGKPYQMQFEYEWSQKQLETIQVPQALYDLRSGQPRQPLPVPKDWQPMPEYNLWASRASQPSLTSPYHRAPVVPIVPRRLEFVSDSWGRLLCYDAKSRQNLRYVITPAGVFDSASAAGYDAGFSGIVGSNNLLQATQDDAPASPLLLADSQGVQRIDIAAGTVRRILNAPHESFAFVQNDVKQVERIWIRNGKQISGYDLPQDDQGAATRDLVQPFVSLTLPDDGRWQGVEISAFDNGYVVHTPSYQQPARFISFDLQGTQISDERFPVIPHPALQVDGNFMLAVIPPILPAGVLAGEAVWVATHPDHTPPMLLWDSDRATATRLLAILAINAFLAMAATFWLTGRRGLAIGSRLSWTITAMLFSWSAALAVLALYPRIVRQRCGACEQARRIDGDHCEHCGACWEPEDREGIEIFDTDEPASCQRPVSDQAAIS